MHNEKLPVYKITGKVTRTGANTPDVPGFNFESEESSCIYLRDLLGDDNRYYAYVQKGHTRFNPVIARLTPWK